MKLTYLVKQLWAEHSSFMAQGGSYVKFNFQAGTSSRESGVCLEFRNEKCLRKIDHTIKLVANFVLGRIDGTRLFVHDHGIAVRIRSATDYSEEVWGLLDQDEGFTHRLFGPAITVKRYQHRVFSIGYGDRTAQIVPPLTMEHATWYIRNKVVPSFQEVIDSPQDWPTHLNNNPQHIHVVQELARTGFIKIDPVEQENLKILL